MKGILRVVGIVLVVIITINISLFFCISSLGLIQLGISYDNQPSLPRATVSFPSLPTATPVYPFPPIDEPLYPPTVTLTSYWGGYRYGKRVARINMTITNNAPRVRLYESRCGWGQSSSVISDWIVSAPVFIWPGETKVLKLWLPSVADITDESHTCVARWLKQS